MSKMIKTLITTFFIFIFSNHFAQEITAREVLSKVGNHYKSRTAPYGYATNYKIYAGYLSNEVVEEHDGVYVKNNNFEYSRIGNTELLSHDNIAAKISNDEKAIVIERQIKSPTLFSWQDYEKGYSFSLKKSDKDYVCEIVPNKVSQSPYAKIILHIDKGSFQILKQELFYIGAAEKLNEDGSHQSYLPRLVTTYKVMKVGSDDLAKYKASNFFTLKASEIHFQKKYSKYKVYKFN